MLIYSKHLPAPPRDWGRASRYLVTLGVSPLCEGRQLPGPLTPKPAGKGEKLQVVIKEQVRLLDHGKLPPMGVTPKGEVT